MNKPIIILKILFLIIGIGSIYSGIDILVDFEDSIQRGFIQIEYDNIFIRYALVFFFMFGGLGFVVLAILAQIKVCPFDGRYQKGDKVEGAKQVLIFISIFLPSITFFALMIYFSDCKNLPQIPIYILSLFFIYAYFGSILRLIISRYKKDITKE